MYHSRMSLGIVDVITQLEQAYYQFNKLRKVIGLLNKLISKQPTNHHKALLSKAFGDLNRARAKIKQLIKGM